MLARQTSVLSPLAGAMQLTGSARGSLIVFAMKNAEGVFPSLPARNERGESWREGKLLKNGLLSPPSPPLGKEREKGSAAALEANHLPNKYWPLASSPLSQRSPFRYNFGDATAQSARHTFSFRRRRLV